MRKLIGLVFVAILGGIIALGGYKLFFSQEQEEMQTPISIRESDTSLYSPPQSDDNKESPVSFVSHQPSAKSENAPDFTKAAEKTVEAVVHVKNVRISHEPRNLSEYLRGIRGGKFIRGMGSGVIITPDGYIVTNNHVIEGANELEVSLSNNKTYKAEVIGADPQEDIALIKIDAKNLKYLPFGDSNKTKVGQWVLAVGNPFNLTSTVTAGIISAKGRNLNEGGTQMQSFIQTDAAINPGNSGGALVNSNGDLIGINTAISSRTGNYIGYSFAVPSNNARKIVEDLMEYGDVRNAILGIRGNTINPKRAKKRQLPISQGVHIVSTSAGAKEAGLRKGDLITKIDGVRVRKIADLSSYIRTKSPGEAVQVNYMRDGKEHIIKVKLTEYETFTLEVAGLEITNASTDYLKKFKTDHGVRIVQTTSRNVEIPQDRFVIVEIDGQAVNSVKKVREMMNQKQQYSHTRITFQSRDGRRETLSF